MSFAVLPPREAAWTGYAWGAGLFLAGTHWLYVSIHVFGQAPLLLAIFLMLGLVFLMGLYYAAVGWVTARIAGAQPLRFLAAAPAVWVLGEWLRGWFLSGFPWLTLGYGQIDTILARFAPLAGVYGVSLALVASAAGCAVLALRRKPALLPIVVALVPWLVAAVIGRQAWTEPAGAAITTSIVQGGVSQDRKWLREQFRPTLALYRQSLFDAPESRLVVWPEVALPALLDQVEGFVQDLESELSDTDRTLLFGILERDGERIYNSVVAVDGRSRQIYRKRHLVPFGEYFPVPAFVREWMRLMNLPYSDISAGADEQALIETRGGERLAVAICYEDAYGAEQLAALREATILINVSNDAWFGDSIAPHQHLQIARMRALEAGRYVVRATNNGVSAFIGPDGSVLRRGDQFRYVAMQHDVVPMRGLTPYARFGNWPVVLACLLLVAGSVYLAQRNQSSD